MNIRKLNDPSWLLLSTLDKPLLISLNRAKFDIPFLTYTYTRR